MIVYVLFDKISKQFTPTFEQATPAAAVRVLKKDAAIMASIDDFLIFEVCRKFDVNQVDGDLPDDFDWSSSICLSKRIIPVSLKDFVGVSVSE